MHDFPSKFSSIGRKREHIGPHEIFRALPSTKYLPNITVWGFPSFISNFWRKHVSNGEHNGKAWKWDLAINHNNPWRTSNNFEALKREYIFHWHKKRIFIVASWVYFTKLFFHSFLNLIWEGLSQWFASQQHDVSGVSLTCPVKENWNIFVDVDHCIDLWESRWNEAEAENEKEEKALKLISYDMIWYIIIYLDMSNGNLGDFDQILPNFANLNCWSVPWR